MKKNFILTSIALILLLSIMASVSVAGEISTERQNRLAFNHLLYLSDIKTTPTNIAPGQEFTLSFTVTNEGDQYVKDIIAKISLPSEITTFQDISTIKTARLEVDEAFNVSFKLLAKPSTAEGVYNLPVSVDYINYIGDEREENETIGIIISSIPSIITELKSTELYKGNNIGKVTINFINNNLANSKFFTVTLLDSEDYDIINAGTVYIGDLDSDDAQAADFKIKLLTNSKNIDLPILITYKDSINNDYSVREDVPLTIRSAKEMGVATNTSKYVSFIVLVLLIGSYLYYRKVKKDKLKKKFIVK